MATGVNDVIVVGGGIIGCLTAYLLAREGLKVTLLEADAVGSHASGFAYGGLSSLVHDQATFSGIARWSSYRQLKEPQTR